MNESKVSEDIEVESRRCVVKVGVRLCLHDDTSSEELNDGILVACIPSEVMCQMEFGSHGNSGESNHNDCNKENQLLFGPVFDTDGMEIETPEAGSAIFVSSEEEWLLARKAEVLSTGDIHVTYCNDNDGDETAQISLQHEQWLYAKYSGIYVQVQEEDN